MQTRGMVVVDICVDLRLLTEALPCTYDTLIFRITNLTWYKIPCLIA